jgi:hypothetical protein
MAGIKPISGTMFKSLTARVFPVYWIEFPMIEENRIKG